MSAYRGIPRGRLHAHVGLLIFFVCLVALIILAPHVRGDDPPKKLVVPTVANYSSAVVAYANPETTEPVTFTLADCTIGAIEGAQLASNRKPKANGYTVTLQPKGAIFITDLAGYLCKPGFALVKAPANVATYSMVSFGDGASRTSFRLDPIGAVAWDRKTKILGPFVSDETYGTWLTMFADDETPAHVRLFSGATGEEFEVEDFTVYPPVTQYRVKAKGTFFLEVGLGDHYWQCFPSVNCSYLEPVHGFASWGDPAGGNLVAHGFEPVAASVGGGNAAPQ
jgi:hypothetical protein